jgi:hypothetical protein
MIFVQSLDFFKLPRILTWKSFKFFKLPRISNLQFRIEEVWLEKTTQGPTILHVPWEFHKSHDVYLDINGYLLVFINAHR